MLGKANLILRYHMDMQNKSRRQTDNVFVKKPKKRHKDKQHHTKHNTVTTRVISGTFRKHKYIRVHM